MMGKLMSCCTQYCLFVIMSGINIQINIAIPVYTMNSTASFCLLLRVSMSTVLTLYFLASDSSIETTLPCRFLLFFLLASISCRFASTSALWSCCPLLYAISYIPFGISFIIYFVALSNMFNNLVNWYRGEIKTMKNMDSISSLR